MPMTANQTAEARRFLADAGTSAVQSIEIDNATGGTFTITFNGQTTSALQWNAQAGDVQNALAALSNVGLGQVNVVENAGVPGSVFFIIYFVGTLAHAAQPVVSVTSSLTGAGVIVTVTQVTAGGVTAFTDAELSDNYDLALANFYLGIAYSFDQLRGNAAKFNEYTAGQSKESKQQIFDHLMDMSEFFHQWANAAVQVQTVRMQGEPPRVQAYPWQPGNPALSLSYRPYNPARRGWGPWGRW